MSRSNDICFPQGFTRLNFTPLETLTIIEHIHRPLNKTFTQEEIEASILKDLITEEDYDIVKVVSTHLSFAKLSLICLQVTVISTFTLRLKRTIKLCLSFRCSVLAEGFSAHLQFLVGTLLSPTPIVSNAHLHT